MDLLPQIYVIRPLTHSQPIAKPADLQIAEAEELRS